MAPIPNSRLSKDPIDIVSDDSDDNFVAPSNDDDGVHVPAKLDDILFGLHRKMIVEDMKKTLMSSFDLQKLHVKKQKGRANSEPSFTRFSARYFSEVLSSLSDYQKSIVQKYEFETLLMFDNSCVPIKFATWIANKVDIRTSEIILKDKIIPITKESVHAVLGLPLGGIEFGKDYEAGRESILSMFGQGDMPSVKFFGDLLMQKKDLSEDQIITSFLIVALGCFLCPNSSLNPSIKYLTIFEDVNRLKSFDWSKFVYESLMTYIKKFQKTKSLGGCLYYLAVYYLDFVDFGSRNIEQGCPRISVWKHDMISTFSELDKINENNFGLRPLKDFKSTCYFQPKPAHCWSNSIRSKLDSAIGTMVPDFLKDKISEMFSAHCCSYHIVDSHSCEDLLVSILLLLAESSQSDPLQDRNEDHVVSSQINSKTGPSSNFDPTSPKGMQSYTPVLNVDGLASTSKNKSICNGQSLDKSVSRSNGKNCPSLERIADFYGSIDNGHDDNILLNTMSIHNNDITSDYANCDVSHHSKDSNALLSSINGANVVVNPCGNDNAPSCLEDQPLLTPDVGYLRTRNNSLNETTQGPSLAALSLVKNVANKFRSRLTHFNSRRPIFGEDMPSFRLLDSDDDASDCDQENELAEDVTPSCSQHFISFQSVDDTPDDMIRGNQNFRTTQRSNRENINKRIFQDLTNSPDVQFIGESKFNDRCKKLCIKTDELYNESNNLSTSTQDFSSSGGKLPIYGPRRVLIPARHAVDPFVIERPRFPITDEENRYFVAICRLADSSKWQSFDAVDIDNVKAKVYSFGHSLKKGGFVSSYVMSVFCRVMFHNNHPSRSKKNYFFPSIGEQLIADASICDMEKVKKSFLGAAKARKLHLCDMLYFPINFNQHWFLFVVDIKDRMFVFLDSLHNEGDEYFEPIMSQLKGNFQAAWDKFVCLPMDFLSFKTVFPPVPRQDFSCDSGIYVMKFIEIWSPRILLSNVLSNENINNIRVQYVNQIFFHPKNQMLQTEIEDVVLN